MTRIPALAVLLSIAMSLPAIAAENRQQADSDGSSESSSSRVAEQSLYQPSAGHVAVVVRPNSVLQSGSEYSGPSKGNSFGLALAYAPNEIWSLGIENLSHTTFTPQDPSYNSSDDARADISIGVRGRFEKSFATIHTGVAASTNFGQNKRPVRIAVADMPPTMHNQFTYFVGLSKEAGEGFFGSRLSYNYIPGQTRTENGHRLDMTAFYEWRPNSFLLSPAVGITKSDIGLDWLNDAEFSLRGPSSRSLSLTAGYFLKSALLTMSYTSMAASNVFANEDRLSGWVSEEVQLNTHVLALGARFEL